MVFLFVLPRPRLLCGKKRYLAQFTSLFLKYHLLLADLALFSQGTFLLSISFLPTLSISCGINKGLVFDPFISLICPVVYLILFRDMAWNYYLHVTYIHISTSSLGIGLKTCTSNSLIDVSIWMFNIYPKLTRQNKKYLFSFPLKICFSLGISYHINHFTYLVVKGKNLGFILDSYLDHTQSNINMTSQTYIKATWMHLPYSISIKPPSSFYEDYNNLLGSNHTSCHSFFNSSQRILLNMLMKLCHLSVQSFTIIFIL